MGVVKKVAFTNNKKYEKESLNFWNSKFIIETLILMIMPIPYYDCHIIMGTKLPGINVTYLLSEILLGLMVFRFYYLIRTILKFSDF